MVGADGLLPLPWIDRTVRHTLATQQAHALLLHGPEGVGQFDVAISLAQSMLCDDAQDRLACGRCGACKLVQARTHPDLLVLLPEAWREALGWSVADEDDSAADKKRKPSKDIRVEEIRLAIAFAQTTSARGRGKVLVLFPAERMNGYSANALLKTLEEPPGDARLLLATASPDLLLPTIRSRCQAIAMPLPDTALAIAWLAERGVVDPDVLLAGAGGQPQAALQWSAEGLTAQTWRSLPAQLQRGEIGTLPAWPMGRLVEALQKLCHDAMRIAAGAAPRYFPLSSMPPKVGLPALSAWSRELDRVARHVEHPWNAALMVESLVQDATRALDSVTSKRPLAGGRSVNSIAR